MTIDQKPFGLTEGLYSCVFATESRDAMRPSPSRLDFVQAVSDLQAPSSVIRLLLY